MSSGGKKRVYIHALNPDEYYEILHNYAEILREKHLPEAKEDELLLKLDEWVTHYHDIFSVIEPDF